MAQDSALSIVEERPLTVVGEKPEKSRVQTAIDAAKDLAIGAAKGAESTVVNTAAPLRRAMGRFAGPGGVAHEPINTMQSIGKAGEQIAEFFVPSGLVGKAETALVGILPKTKWGLALARAVPEAASAYGVSKAQGDPNAGVSAAVGGLIPGGAKLFNARRQIQGAEQLVGSALGASGARFNAIAKKVAPDVLSGKHGSVWGLTLKSIQERAESLTDSIGDKIEQQIQQYGKLNFSDTLSGITQQLEHAKDAYRVVVPAEHVLTRTGELAEHAILFNAQKVNQLSRLQHTIDELKNFDVGTLDNLIGIRRAWDEVVKAAGGFAERGSTGTRMAASSLRDRSEAWAKREGVRAIRQVLSDPKFTDLDKLRGLNAQYSFWTNIQDLTEHGLGKHQDQAGRVIKALGVATGAMLGEQMGSQRGGTTGGVAGGVLGAMAGGASAGGWLGKQIVEASRSPAFRLASAQVKQRLADAIMSGRLDVASRILGRFSAAAVAGTPKPTLSIAGEQAAP